MKDNKITISYSKTEDKKLSFYLPHSDYLLRENIVICSVVFGIILVVDFFWIAELIHHNHNHFDILITFLFSLSSIILGVFSTITEWKNGRNYKQAIELINKFSEEDKEKIREKFKQHNLDI